MDSNIFQTISKQSSLILCGCTVGLAVVSQLMRAPGPLILIRHEPPGRHPSLLDRKLSDVRQISSRHFQPEAQVHGGFTHRPNEGAWLDIQAWRRSEDQYGRRHSSERGSQTRLSTGEFEVQGLFFVLTLAFLKNLFM